jgi:hypothetical protein
MARDFLSSIHARDVERVPHLEAALKDLSKMMEDVDSDDAETDDSKTKKKQKGRGMIKLMKPLRLALTAKKVSKEVSRSAIWLFTHACYFSPSVWSHGCRNDLDPWPRFHPAQT